MIEEFADAGTLAAEAAGATARALQAALDRAGSAGLAATGGRSPGAVYDLLAQAPLEWARVRVTLTDERFVDPQSADSNEALVRARLLRGPAAEAGFQGLRGVEPSLEAAARLAAEVLGGWPPFDVVLLGMGEDGHVASLFPGNPALHFGLDPAAPACLAVPEGLNRPPPQARITLTLRPLTTAGLVLILISGRDKRRLIERAMKDGDPMQFPVAAILQSAPCVRILWTA